MAGQQGGLMLLAPGHTIRLFVSSTFSDMRAERNVLQDDVFPAIRILAAQHGLRFQAIDLRWGVSEEAGRHNLTMRTCLRELARCQAGALRPNFVVLLGDRYGWQPLPEIIPADLFRTIAADIEAHDRANAALLECYREDRNNLPPVFVLQPRSGAVADYPSWHNQVETPLLGALKAASQRLRGTGVPHAQRQALDSLGLGLSATHQEIVHGALTVPDAAEHVHVFMRSLLFRTGGKKSPAFVDLEADGTTDPVLEAKRTEVTAQLKRVLPAANLHAYRVPWHESEREEDCVRREDLDDFKRGVFEALSSVIVKQAAAVAAAPAASEDGAHRAFADYRRSHFTGREEPLKSIARYIQEGGPPLLVRGPTGCGKSTVMSQAAADARVTMAGRQCCIIERYIGATLRSSSTVDLLTDVLSVISSLATESHSTIDGVSPLSDLQEISKRFVAALHRATDPIVLFLDAVDRIRDDGRWLAWLPTDLPPNVRIIFSASSDDDSHGLLEQLLSERNPVDRQVSLPPMTADDGARLLGAWLNDSGRGLQESQSRALLERFGAEGRPLWLRIAASEAERVADWQPLPELPTGINGLIRFLFTGLSRDERHGEVLVRRALGYLACARSGLAEDEMLDVLSSEPDGAVLQSVIARSPTERAKPESERIRSLPVAVWVPFRADIAPFVSQYEFGGVLVEMFFHDSIRQVALNAFVALPKERKERHSHLADVFWRHGDPSGRARWDGTVRGLEELPYHLDQAGPDRQQQATRVFETLSYADQRCIRATVRGLVSDLESLQFPTALTESLLTLIRRHRQLLERHPSTIFGLLHHLSAGVLRDACHAAASGWPKAWIRTTPLPAPPSPRSEPVLVASVESQFEFGGAGIATIADEAGLLFYLLSLGSLAVVDVDRNERVEPPVRIGPHRPLLITASSDGRRMAVAYENGEVDVIQLWFAEGHVVRQQLECRRSYLVPDFEAPVMIWTGATLCFQADQHTLERVVEGIASQVQLPTDCTGEISGMADFGETLAVTIRQSGATQLVMFDGSVVTRQSKLGEFDVTTLAASNDKGIACACSDNRIRIVSIDDPSASVTSFDSCGLPTRVDVHGDVVIWSTENKVMFLDERRDHPQQIRGDVELHSGEGVLRIARRGERTLILTTRRLMAARSPAPGAAPDDDRVEHLFAFGDGSTFAVVRRGTEFWWLECGGSTSVRLRDVDSGLIARNESGDVLAAGPNGGGVLAAATNPSITRLLKLPAGIIAIAPRFGGGFWLTDRGGTIYRFDQHANCHPCVGLGAETHGGSQLAASRDWVVWKGVALLESAQRNGPDDNNEVLVFYRVSGLQLNRAGHRILKKQDGFITALLFEPRSQELIMFTRSDTSSQIRVHRGSIDKYIRDDERVTASGAFQQLQLAASSEDGKELLALHDGALSVFKMDSMAEVASLSVGVPITWMGGIDGETEERGLFVAGAGAPFRFEVVAGARPS